MLMKVTPGSLEKAPQIVNFSILGCRQICFSPKRCREPQKVEKTVLDSKESDLLKMTNISYLLESVENRKWGSTLLLCRSMVDT